MTAAATPDLASASRDHLTASGRLQWNLRAATADAQTVIEELLQELEASETRTRRRRKGDREALRATMEAMVLGLAAAHRSSKPWRAYSRQKNDYSFFVEHGGVTWTAVITVADFLTAQGLAEARMGSFSRPESGGKGGRGYQSRLRATSLLMRRLLPSKGGVATVPVAFPIRLKGSKDAEGRKPLLRPDDWPAADPVVFGLGGTEAAAERVWRANELRARCQITLEGVGQPAGWDGDADPEDRVDTTDHTATHLYRVFSNGSWRQGGRFYGGFWQGLAKADRSRLLIDGEEAVELDYQACHVRMCYHLDGAPLPMNGDPYAIPGVAPELRGAVKALILRLLGAGESTRVQRPEILKAWPRRDYLRLIHQIAEVHPMLAHWFRSGHWATLQNIDSQIADAVLADLSEQGVPCLPVHDSFIVPRSAEKALGVAMATAWREVLSRESDGVEAYPVITGWTSEEMEVDHRSILPPLPPSVSVG